MKIQATLNAASLKFAVVVSQHNERVSSKLLEGAVRTLRKHEALDENLDIAYAPTNADMPLLAKVLAKSNRYDAVICLGCLLLDEQTDSSQLCQSFHQSLTKASFDSETPVINGLLSVQSSQQAIEHSGLQQGNKGSEAAMQAIEMANLVQQIKDIEPSHSGFSKENTEKFANSQAERL